jgi:transposase
MTLATEPAVRGWAGALRHRPGPSRNHPHRLVTHRQSAFRSAFAALAGTFPVLAPSGGTTRFRLNRGGDRQLNKAIYTIALIRMNRDHATKNYIAKRTGQGRTKKEIIRSLKRYITRQIYRQLNSADNGLAVLHGAL